MKIVMNMKNRIFKSIIFIALLVLSTNAVFAQDMCGEEIWMGWATNEYNGMSYGAVANNNEDSKLKINGYGRYQFKNTTNLIDFLDYADNTYFREYIEYGKGSERLNDYNYGLPQAWTDYYVNNNAKFIEKQDRYLYTNYYVPITNYFREKGIELWNKSPYVKGAILSIVMHRYNNNEITQNISRQAVSDLIDLYVEDDKAYITKIYDMVKNKYTKDELKKRFSSEKQACLEERDDEFKSTAGEILNKYGKANGATFIRELNNLNPSIFKEFLINKKFTEASVLDWYDAVTTSVDYNKGLNISSGVLDFGTSTSRGINIDGYIDLIENEVVFKMPNNYTNIYYIPQNTNIASYSDIKFGINNVAQAGSSLACLSMAINKLQNRNNNNLVLPGELITEIINRCGDFNYYYDKNRQGNRNEIISDIASWYSLSSAIISKASVLTSLVSGNIVIARVQDSEFTKYGTFILLCGVREHNEKQYVIVADPNIYHARYLYNLYDIEYIANTCKGIFFEIRR